MAMTKAEAVIHAIRKAGLTPEIQGDKLIVRGPQNRLTEDLRRRIKEHKAAIMARLFDDAAVAMLSSMFARVNSAYPPGSKLASRDGFLDDEEKRINAAYVNRDLKSLQEACLAYEKAAMARFREALSNIRSERVS